MKKKFIVSKVYKVPIEGITFSNKQVGLTIEYELVGGEEFNVIEANDELNQMLEIIKESDPSWIHKLTLENKKKDEKEKGKS